MNVTIYDCSSAACAAVVLHRSATPVEPGLPVRHVLLGQRGARHGAACEVAGDSRHASTWVAFAAWAALFAAMLASLVSPPRS